MRIHEAAEPAQLPGHVRLQRRRHGVELAHRALLRRQQQFERIEALDGQTRRVFRHNELVQTLWPASRVAVIEQRDALTRSRRCCRAATTRYVEHYELRAQGADRVAGHEAEVLLLKPRDAHRFGSGCGPRRTAGCCCAPTCSARATRCSRAAAFSDVAIGVRPQPEAVLQPMKQARRLARAAAALTRDPARGRGLVAAGRGARLSPDQLRQAAAGRAARRRRRGQGAAGDILRRPDPRVGVRRAVQCRAPQRPMRTAIGATHTLMRRQGDGGSP